MEFVEKQLSTKVTYEGKVINITLDDIELPDGKKSFREVIRHPGGVVAVAMKDENTILMVKQYRYAIQKVSIELPAGKLEKDEDIHDAIKRELLEETGYRAKNWKDLGYINTQRDNSRQIIDGYFPKENLVKAMAIKKVNKTLCGLLLCLIFGIFYIFPYI